MEIIGKTLQLPAVYKKPHFFLLQVMQESISGTTSHVRASERAMKLKVRMIKSLSSTYQAIPGKKCHLFSFIGIVTHAAHL